MIKGISYIHSLLLVMILNGMIHVWADQPKNEKSFSDSYSSYRQIENLFTDTCRVRNKAVENSINGNYTYQCEDQFLDTSNIRIFRNGEAVDSSNYILYKQGKVQFTDCIKVNNGDVYFDYLRSKRYFEPFSNDLSKDVSMFNEVHSECDGKMYDFVRDPLDKNRNVLMINCATLLPNAKNARQQFSYKKYHLTYFKDTIKLFLPEDMKEAMLSYPKAITWFGIQGAWGVFGSPTGQTEKMFSGSGNALGISKPTPTSNELYFYLRCRRRHCDPNTGCEIYDVLNDELSSFPVKAGEWITIEREWRIGNPGICNHTIIDSDGTHEFFVSAYNSVCDPENELARYGDKFAGVNPYNYCYPFICKLYTSNDIAQYCIDKIGKCYLYYKDYELIEAENVNAFN